MLSNTQVAAGDFSAASQAFGELARTSQQAGHIMIAVGALCHLAEVHLRLAQLDKAKAAYEKAIAVAADVQGQRLPIAGEALMGLGDVCRELNELEVALHYTLDGIELSRLWRPVNAALGYLTLARIKQTQGNVKDADEAMEAARRLATQYDTNDMGNIGAAFYQALLWVEQGNLDAASQWAKERRLDGEIDPAELDRKDDYVSYHLRKYEYLVLARLLIAQNRLDEALSILESVLIRMEQQGRTRLLIEALMLKALALRARSNLAQASATMERALTLAEPGGYVRLFADEGPPMARLLREVATHGLAPKYVAKLLAAFEETPKDRRAPETVPSLSVSAQPSLVEPLSERELQVLRLLATGLSNPEIARQLYVAVSTIRSHAKSIYGKLNVHGRWEAVRRAKELRLL
jgi:LuxR family maltose regulon positive regulatory protein